MVARDPNDKQDGTGPSAGREKPHPYGKLQDAGSSPLHSQIFGTGAGDNSPIRLASAAGRWNAATDADTAGAHRLFGTPEFVLARAEGRDVRSSQTTDLPTRKDQEEIKKAAEDVIFNSNPLNKKLDAVHSALTSGITQLEDPKTGQKYSLTKDKIGRNGDEILSMFKDDRRGAYPSLRTVYRTGQGGAADRQSELPGGGHYDDQRDRRGRPVNPVGAREDRNGSVAQFAPAASDRRPPGAEPVPEGNRNLKPEVKPTGPAAVAAPEGAGPNRKPDIPAAQTWPDGAIAGTRQLSPWPEVAPAGPAKPLAAGPEVLPQTPVRPADTVVAARPLSAEASKLGFDKMMSDLRTRSIVPDVANGSPPITFDQMSKQILPEGAGTKEIQAFSSALKDLYVDSSTLKPGTQLITTENTAALFTSIPAANRADINALLKPQAVKAARAIQDNLPADIGGQVAPRIPVKPPEVRIEHPAVTPPVPAERRTGPPAAPVERRAEPPAPRVEPRVPPAEPGNEQRQARADRRAKPPHPQHKPPRRNQTEAAPVPAPHSVPRNERRQEPPVKPGLTRPEGPEVRPAPSTPRPEASRLPAACEVPHGNNPSNIELRATLDAWRQSHGQTRPYNAGTGDQWNLNFARALTREGRSLNLNSEQSENAARRITALETGGWADSREATGTPPCLRGPEHAEVRDGQRPVGSSARGPIQLLRDSSVAQIKANGAEFAGELRQEAKGYPSGSQRQAELEAKAILVEGLQRDLSGGARRESLTNAVHALNLDADVGPMMQAKEWANVMHRAGDHQSVLDGKVQQYKGEAGAFDRLSPSEQRRSLETALEQNDRQTLDSRTKRWVGILGGTDGGIPLSKDEKELLTNVFASQAQSLGSMSATNLKAAVEDMLKQYDVKSRSARAESYRSLLTRGAGDPPLNRDERLKLSEGLLNFRDAQPAAAKPAVFKALDRYLGGISTDKFLSAYAEMDNLVGEAKAGQLVNGEHPSFPSKWISANPMLKGRMEPNDNLMLKMAAIENGNNFDAGMRPQQWEFHNAFRQLRGQKPDAADTKPAYIPTPHAVTLSVTAPMAPPEPARPTVPKRFDFSLSEHPESIVPGNAAPEAMPEPPDMPIGYNRYPKPGEPVRDPAILKRAPDAVYLGPTLWSRILEGKDQISVHKDFAWASRKVFDAITEAKDILKKQGIDLKLLGESMTDAEAHANVHTRNYPYNAAGRSFAAQAAARSLSRIAAPAGRGLHELGFALDIQNLLSDNRAEVAATTKVLQQLHFHILPFDPAHAQLRN